MSYTRTAHTTLSKTVSVSYPKSESGGSKSITIDIPVDIHVHVDTDFYDANIDKCNRHINLLTGAIVATEAAEIQSKRENAFKIGKSLISGFFGYVRSEISQQIAELKTKVDSVILHLAQLRKGCQDKEAQMSADFSRITSRYSKIFKDLDSEITNRITALDAPAFKFVSLSKSVHNRMSENALLGTITVGANENSYLQSILFASSVKRRAQEVIQSANQFIVETYRQKRNFESVKFEGNISGTRYIPVIFSESINLNRGNSTDLYGLNSTDIFLSKEVVESVGEKFTNDKLVWQEVSEQSHSKLALYFNNEVDINFTQGNAHSDRVKKMILSMWKNNKLNVLSNN